MSGEDGPDAVIEAMRDNILQHDGSMAPNYFPQSHGSRSYLSSEKYKRNADKMLFESFKKSREALQAGDIGMAQAFLKRAVDSNHYGEAQYAFDIILKFQAHPFHLGDTLFSPKASPGRAGRLAHLSDALELKESEISDFHALHTRSFLNTASGKSHVSGYHDVT